METLGRRIPLVLILLAVLATILLGQLLSFQLRLSPSIQNFEANYSSREGVTQRIAPKRGQIYDRDGVVLAVNTFEYRVGISPSLVVDRRQAALDLARILGLDEAEVYRQLQPDADGAFARYVLLASPIDDATARQLEDLELNGLLIESIPLRAYPQGDLMAQIVGFVNYGGRGFFGVEGKYDRLLTGTAREVASDGTLLDVSEVPDARDGQSLVLTVDRDIQFVVDQVLREAILKENALGGTILVMNPRTGEILAMQSYPTSTEGDASRFNGQRSYNPSIGDLFEPGSIIKVVSASIALQADQPGLDLNWTYNNTGCFEAVGVRVCDFDRAAKGNVDFRRCLIQSLNTCTATWYTLLGPSQVYERLREFGFGTETGVDMEGEAAGLLRLPGDPLWSEADFLNISYGQGLAVTPLQILNAVNAIANDGLLMQPHIVLQRIDGTSVFDVAPNPVARPISKEVADAITAIMVDTMAVGTIDELARVEGYTIAGKTGTAKNPPPGGYSPTESWASFVGFLPADDPIISVLVLLDTPAGYWGSQTAAPVFQDLVERLVVLLEIPPDAVRTQLVEAGGRPFERDY